MYCAVLLTLTPSFKVDLETELCPKTCENFLKASDYPYSLAAARLTCPISAQLCKTYYYNLCSFFNGQHPQTGRDKYQNFSADAHLFWATVQQDFIAQTGDPTDTSTGGQAYFPNVAYFTPEYRLPKLKHAAFGTLSMAVANQACGSQFFFTLKEDMDYLDGKHVPFGRIVGEDSQQTLRKMNEVFVDDKYRPLRDVRIRHVIVLGRASISFCTLSNNPKTSLYMRQTTLSQTQTI